MGLGIGGAIFAAAVCWGIVWGGATAGYGEVLHHFAGWDWAREIVEAERRAAREISAVRLRRYGGGASRAAAALGRGAFAADPGDVDGLHARVCVGGNVSGVYGRADAAGVPAGANCGAESYLAEDGDGRDSERSGVEGRGVRRGAKTGAANGAGFAADRGERAAADAEDAADAGCGG